MNKYKPVKLQSSDRKMLHIKNQTTMLANRKYTPGMNKTNTRTYMKQVLQLRFWAMLLMLLPAFQAWSQSVNVLVTTPEVCLGNQTLFSASAVPPAGATVTRFRWEFSVGAPVNTPSGSYLFAFPAGNHTVRVFAVFSNGDSIVSTTQPFTVFHKPIPAFTVQTPATQCFKDNLFTFFNTSIQNPASPSNPLRDIEIGFGDGVFQKFPATTASFTHSYNASGNFNPFIRLTDDKGCDTVIFFQRLPTDPPIRVRPDIQPLFTTTLTQGPCFRSTWTFNNTTAIARGAVSEYRWTFGDGNSFSSTMANDPAKFDNIVHTYLTGGDFTVELYIKDTAGCEATKVITEPYNIFIKFDVKTDYDSVCFKEGSDDFAQIEFSMTPIPRVRLGTNDFEWNFGDPNAPVPPLVNIYRDGWNFEKVYSGMGHFLPTVTVRNICPDTTFNYFSMVIVGTQGGYTDTGALWWPDHDSAGVNFTPPPPTNTVPYVFPRPLGTDNITFINTGRTRMGMNPREPLLAYTIDGAERPIYFFPQSSPLINGGAATVSIPWTTLNTLNHTGYGVFVTGPNARIEDPQNQVFVADRQKRQCGGRDTVDFVNTSQVYKSRRTFRIWDFDDPYAPRCTSFSVARDTGVTQFLSAIDQDRNSVHFFRIENRVIPGRIHCNFSTDSLPRHKYAHWDTVLGWYKTGKDFMPWNLNQFTYNGLGTGANVITGPDTAFWGRPVYINILTGEFTNFQGSTDLFFEIYDQTLTDSLTGLPFTRQQVRRTTTPITYPWPRIDTINFEFNNNQDIVGPFAPFNMQNVPDPIAMTRGVRPYTNYLLNGQMNASFALVRSAPGGNIWFLDANTMLPTGDRLYDYAFKRSVMRPYTVLLTMIDSANNNTGEGVVFDATRIDDGDCASENQLLLSLTLPDAHGLSLTGIICPGPTSNGGAQLRFSTAAAGGFPGMIPNTGQSFLIVNHDSLADRRDQTPCELDGFTTFLGGITPGAVSPSIPVPGSPPPRPMNRPRFNVATDYNPAQPNPWGVPMLPTWRNQTQWIYHYDPDPNAPMGLPVDPLGWVTIGIAIGNGAREFIVEGQPASATPPPVLPTPVNVVNPLQQRDIDSTISYIPAPAGQYNFQFSHATNRRIVLGQEIVDWVYYDDNYPNCVSRVVWYHRFFRILNTNPSFTEFPQHCSHRGRGDTITVFYESYTQVAGIQVPVVENLFQDSIRYSTWSWGDGTVTVDSFWYSNPNFPDSVFFRDQWYSDPLMVNDFFSGGVRRVRYNFDLVTSELIDSIEWPAKLAIQPRIRPMNVTQVPGNIYTDTVIGGNTFKLETWTGRARTKIDTIWYNDSNWCTGGWISRAPFFVVDSALMFFPLQHVFKRTSYDAVVYLDTLNAKLTDPLGDTIPWTAEEVRRQKLQQMETAQPGILANVMGTTTGCISNWAKVLPIGVIDTFTMHTGSHDGPVDTIFCANEPVYFRDSVRYWRYDCQISSLPFNPGRTRPRGSPIVIFPPNDPRAILHIDVFDFWRFAEFAPSQIMGYDLPVKLYVNTTKWSPDVPLVNIASTNAATGSNQVIQTPGQLLRNTTRVRVNTPGASGLDPNIDYYVVNANLATFQLAPIRNGNPATIASTGNIGLQVMGRTFQIDTFRRVNAVIPSTNNLGRRIVTEQIRWFFGDGDSAIGTRVSHQYSNFGRFEVKMISRDSLGFFDTTISYVTIVEPRAVIHTTSDLFGCSDIPEFTDTSFIDFGTGNTSADTIAKNWWWFGENKADTVTPNSINRRNVANPYRSNGPFRIKLAIETEQGCRDTAYRDIFITGPRPYFQLLSDTIGCAPMRIRVLNLPDSLGKRNPTDTPTAETIIYWGDGSFSILNQPRDTVVEKVYDQEGVFSIVAVGRDVPLPGSVNCRLVYYPDTVDGFNQPINIRIFKYENNIAGDRRFICEGEELEITNTSDSNFTAFRYNVYMQPQDSLVDQLAVTGPATTGNPLVNRLSFPNRGNYNIVSAPTAFSANIPVEARPNCEVTDTVQVTVSATTAAFTIDSANFPRYIFNNTSENAVRYEWTIAKESEPNNFLPGSPKLGNTGDPNWEFDLGNDTGLFIVCLKAISSDSLGACEDTTCQIVNNSFTTDIKVYNVFTPFGSPGSNDQFVVDIQNEVSFEIKIFNRWGGKVFESTDKNVSWNGKVNNDGAESPAGVYYYIINYQLRAQEPKSVNGTVTLIKD